MVVESSETQRKELGRIPSLVDWDMYSDRNDFILAKTSATSLVDWDMYSDRNFGD